MKAPTLMWRVGCLVIVAALAAGVVGTPAHAKLSVLSSPHNLSASGGRGGSRPGVSFSEERRVCVFCHVPHQATPGLPLWSRPLSPEGTNYQLYQSSTLSAAAVTGKPTGASRLCLSCHDGTIALGQFAGSGITTTVTMPGGTTDNPNLTVNLTDDHPISIQYTESVAQQSQLVSPSALQGRVRLEGGSVLQCTSCHDPHDNQYGDFLVINNTNPALPNYQPGAPLCVACHRPAGWDNAAHNPVRTPTLPNGCVTCHVVHNAPRPVRLLRGAKLEDTCYQSCHNGTGVGADIKSLLGAGMHRHPVGEDGGGVGHDEKESLPAAEHHVQCVDCHNPHQAALEATPLSLPPFVNGTLRGVVKDNLGGMADYEYEICFKCHSGANADKFAGVLEPKPNRVIAEQNQAFRFDILNPSFHPVMADRKTSGASLLVELQSSMKRIYCSDCHNNSLGTKAGGSGPNGPHGSQFAHILIGQYDMPMAGGGTTSYNKSQYALCFRCHSEDYVMVAGTAFNDAGVNEHSAHVRDRLIPCFACHDPHGIPWRLGGTTANNAHLVNFDKDYTVGVQVANPLYVTNTPGSGSCTVNCHTVAGNTHSYTKSAAKGVLRFKPAAVPKKR
ncbi:hypothetical protein KP004_14855 [Geomonas oryzisoli]|uniref:Doubled CXXCH motif domain-containing protein n=1 Tax=Geomonas oryzisoli TaxID=2847992 RepID=A0ABX8J3U2_9BACT|nr:cytochrome c3 family protein [Geomonas oryzisoli]QWV92473.1 hypothetical protein KP004_14855 [Geomonas oryzisoli]